MSWNPEQTLNCSSVSESLFSSTLVKSATLQLPGLDKGSSVVPRTIAFVDPNVSDAMTVIAGLQADVKVLLDPAQDGITQITEILGHYKDLTEINVISHGKAAELQLGNSSISASSLKRYESDLQQWKSALTSDADILFYGCNVASGEDGQAFIDNLSNLTGADVAASTDLTGDATQGGDWTLEYITGDVEAATPFTVALMDSYQGLLATLFTTQTPTTTNATDGAGSAGDYELGMEFRTTKAGTINAIRYYKATSETGTHVGRIWSSTGTLLASVTFTSETGSGWQQQALSTPLTIAANTTYVVSVNANSYYVTTNNGLATTLTNGDISAVADGSNGVYNETPTAFPTQSYQNSNYFRDIVFTPTNPVNNTPGTIGVAGTATQNQTLSATVSDANGLAGVTIAYQWQQSSNGTTWTNITGATNQTYTLTQAQVNNQIRATATYTDALGSSESVNSNPTTAIANVNDLGTISIGGITTQGNILTATVSDADGLPGSIAYQWQQSSNGTTWNNISGATNQSITLGGNLVGQQVRVNATYTDVLGGTENVFSTPTSAITAVAATQSLFTTQTPTTTNATDGAGSAGDYELGMEFRSARAGTINAIRYYKATSETGTHVGRIWSSTGTLLASVTFTSETGSGWQQQALTTPLTIAANTTYVVSVNANTHYVATNNGLATTLTNGDISAVADGSNGVFNTTPASFPTQSFQNSNYFRDIDFTPNITPNNNPGTVTLSGNATQNQVLSATVSDTDGLSGATINYQWQQSSNGITWTNIAGATNQTFTLTQAQVSQLVRAQATYTDTLGSGEVVTSPATTAIANVNDLGTVTISGTAATGNTLTANVADPDGLGTIAYQWQQSSNGTTWTNIAGATNQTLTLNNGLLNQRVRVNAIYTDALQSSENILSAATNPIATISQAAIRINAGGGQYTDGLGQLWQADTFFSGGSTFTTGNPIGSTTDDFLFQSERWGNFSYNIPIANGTYNINLDSAELYWTATNRRVFNVSAEGSTAISNLDIYAQVGKDNAFTRTINNVTVSDGVLNLVFTGVVDNAKVDAIEILPVIANPNNNPGTVTLSGNATQNQVLSATVSDTDGLSGATINYQWQQFVNNAWTNITGATTSTLTLDDAQVGDQVRVRATYTDTLGTSETIFSNPTATVANVNDLGISILKGSATVGQDLTATIFDADGLPATIAYQWQQFVGNTWTNIAGATTRSLIVTNTLLGLQVRALASYIDALGSSENVASSGALIAAQNAIVLENQKTGTRGWEIPNSNIAINEISGYGNATSINKGQSIDLKISLSQAGQYRIDVYRLGYYGGNGGRLVTSVAGLNGVRQADPTITDPATRLVEYNWNTSYTLQTGSDWTTGLYFVKLTDSLTGKQNYIQFVLRDDGRPADIGFQDAITTAAAYNSNGGSSTYDFNSPAGRSYQVSFDRPFQYNSSTNSEAFNNTLTWEYNMTRWLESQGYDVSYYSNLDVHSNPLLLYSQNAFLSVGHDEYWSMDMFDNVEQARDNGINLAFFSANTAYWQVRFDPSTSGQANRVMTVYKDSSGVGSNPSIDPVAQTNPAAATTLFRSSEVNRPENSLLGVGYIGDWGANNVYNGRDFVVSNAADPYYANTGLQNGDRLIGLVGYEWDAVLNNGSTPAGLVVLSQSPVPSGGLIPLGLLPPGTDDTISNSVRYTAPSGAKVFSTGSVQWMWGLDSDRVPNPRVDARAQQIAVNVFADMGAKPQTPSAGIVVA